MFRYKVVLDSDAEEYNGHKRIDPTVQYVTSPEQWDNRRNNMHVCIVHKLFFVWYSRVKCIFIDVSNSD